MLHPGVHHRPRRCGARRDSGGSAGEVVPPAGVGRDAAQLRLRAPDGRDWRGFQDIDPGVLTRERIVDFLDRVDPEAILAVVPHGTPKQVAHVIKEYVDAGLRVPKILDYGGDGGAAVRRCFGRKCARSRG